MFNEAAGRVFERDGKTFIVTEPGYDGNAVYGPYEVLEPGRYAIAFEVAAHVNAELDETTVCARVDVAANYGATLYAQGEITWRELKSSPAIALLGFDLDQSEKLEFRVYSTGEVPIVAHERHTLVRLGDQMEVNTPEANGFPDPTILPKPTRFVQNAPELRRLYELGLSFNLRRDGFAMSYNGLCIDDVTQDDINNAGGFFPLGSHVNISYAQFREDVILAQALCDVSRDDGFYIDVGANDPNFETVTRLFYERGWRGLNVEPSPDWIAKLNEFRPRDINVQAALSDKPGTATFHDIAGGQLGTLHSEFAQRHADAGMERRTYTVPVLILADLCEQHAPRDIHFLKVDVEGFEGAVLRGMDFNRFRPWVLCIEATEPLLGHKLTHHDWDPLLRSAGYLFVSRDGVNRYYVAEERSYLEERFAKRPFGYVRA